METHQSQSRRALDIADETRQAIIPYDIERGEETIVAGMQLDFTATKNYSVYLILRYKYLNGDLSDSHTKESTH